MSGRSSGPSLGRGASIAVGVGVAIASWMAMALALGYSGMQRSISLSLAKIGEVLPAFLIGGTVAFGVCWLTIAVSKRTPRATIVFAVLALLDLGAATLAIALFNEIPPERILIVILDATGGGAQLVGAAIALRLFAGKEATSPQPP